MTKYNFYIFLISLFLIFPDICLGGGFISSGAFLNRIPFSDLYSLKLLLIALMISFVLTLLWIFSPLGVCFIICVLLNSFIKNKRINLIVWSFQVLILCFSLFLILVGLIFSYLGSRNGNFLLILGILGFGINLIILTLGGIVFQFLYKRERNKICQK